MNVLHIFSPCHVDEYGVKNYHVTFSILISFIILVLCITSMAGILYEAEDYSVTANIHSYWDSVWVLTMVASTIGFGDYYPTTLVGRITAGFISFIGMGLYSYITSTLVLKIMSWTQTEVKNRELRHQNAEIIKLAREIVLTNKESIEGNNRIERYLREKV